MIEPSEQKLLFRVPAQELARMGDAVQAYAESVRLVGSRDKEPKLWRYTNVAAFDQNLDPSDPPRGIFLLYNSETNCAGILLRVWDDEQTDLAAQMAEQVSLFLKDRFEMPLNVMEERECKLIF
jgi:hypothetical protein